MRHGEKDATTDRATIEAWWSRYPEANVGIATGGRSGIDVLDIDGEIGQATLDALIAKHGPLPRTVIARSGSGGTHFYFRHDPRAETKNNVLPKIDVRADGGYVVAPPSNHVAGFYQWIVSPDEAEVADWPAWLIDELLAAKPDREPIESRPAKRDRQLAIDGLRDEIVPTTLRDSHPALQKVYSGCPIMREWWDEQEAGKKIERDFWIAGLGVLRHLEAGLEEARRLEKKVMGEKFSESEFRRQVASLTKNATSCLKLARQSKKNLGCGTDKNPCRFPATASPILHTKTVADPETPRPKEEVLSEITEAISRFFTPEGPKTLLISGEAGLGKSHATQDEIAKRGARVVYVAPTHDLLDQVVADLQGRGVDAAKRPELKEACDDPVRRGRVLRLQERQEDYVSLVCRTCPRRKEKTCSFWNGAATVGNRQVSVYAHARLRYGRRFGSEVGDRPLVIDEDAVGSLVPIVAKTLRALKRLRRIYKHAASEASERPRDLLRDRVRLLGRLVRIFEGTRSEVEVFYAKELPVSEIVLDKKENRAFAKALAKARRALGPRYRKVKVETEFLAAFNRFAKRGRGKIVGFVDRTHPNEKKHVLVLHHRVFVPPELPVLLLDATGDRYHASKALGRPEAEIEVVGGKCEHGSRIHQWVDESFGLSAIKKPDVSARSVEAVRRLIGSTPLSDVAIITHKVHEEVIRREFPGATTAHFGDLRGRNDMKEAKLLIVLGSPRKPFHVVRATALFVYGASMNDIRDRPKTLNKLYRGQVVKTYGFERAIMDRAWRHCVASELLQAAGRVRYLRAVKTVHVLSNEILDLPGVVVGRLAEPKERRERPEASESRERLLRAAKELLEREGRVSRRRVADRAEVHEITARRHWSSIIEELGLVLRGRHYVVNGSTHLLAG